jgi:pyridinium-3,5-biscarboxylic acid mononucleotide sulfurtransferase
MQKIEHLTKILKSLDAALVAFSGGVDSTFLLKVARDALGDRVTALTAVSASIPAHELEEAKALAQQIGVRHLLINSAETEDPRYIANPTNRCYYCKSELYRICNEVAERESIVVLDGVNLDDLGDHRPGRQAAAEAKVRSPLVEAKFTKAEIREASKALGLPTWDKPQLACLASRFPYGTSVTPERLTKVGRAEAVVREAGLRQFRVRFHEQIARVEVDASEFSKLFDVEVRGRIVTGIKAVGFTFVVLDLEPFRSGRLNEAAGIPKKLEL